MNRFLPTFLVLALTVAAPAHAALFEINDPSLPASPDGFNLTYDDVTGFEWLDLTVTAGRTYDDIVGNDGSDELGPGGDFAGFRHATFTEVTGWASLEPSLYLNWSTFGSTFQAVAPYPDVLDFMSYLGCFTNCGDYGFNQGIFVDDLDPTDLFWAQVEAYPGQGPNFGSLLLNPNGPITSRIVNGALDTSGHYLVRSVPEPSTALLIGLGLVVGLTRRRCAGAGVVRARGPRERRSRPVHE